MKARIVQIGNSRGIRLPKPLIEEAGLEDEVDIHVRDRSIIITSATKARTGWSESAKRLHAQEGASLVDSLSSTNFDETEWEW